MDATRPEVPPDFIFPPGEETSFRLSTLKSLANWRSAHHHLPSNISPLHVWAHNYGLSRCGV